jgi:CRISPR-associated endonuclease Cas1
MPSSNTPSVGSIPIRNGILAVTGYSIKVAVCRNELVIEDGTGRERRRGRYAKAPAKLKRLLVIGKTGYVTLEALEWLDGAGAAFLRLDYDAKLLTLSTPFQDDARMRRAQALLPLTDYSLTVARELIAPKIHNQLAVLNSFGVACEKDINAKAQGARVADSMEALLQFERQAAEMYWTALSRTPVRFSHRDHSHDHWRMMGARGSPLSPGARYAVTPAHAMINYLYALLEVEARLALMSRGLDPGLGIFHVDLANRQSFAADLMEPVRPHVDAYVLNLIRNRVFGVKDFFETRDGGCRLSSKLTRELAATMPEWGKHVAPYADMVARYIAKLANHGLTVQFPGPRAKQHSLASDLVVSIRRPALVPPEVKKTVPLVSLHNACKSCGAAVTTRRRIYCDSCFVEWKRNGNAAFLNRTAVDERIAGHAERPDSPNSLAARCKRALTASKNRIAVTSWRDDGSLDGVDFRRDIWPHLRGLMVKEIAQATGLTLTYASQARAGKVIPHKRHWRVLQNLVTR